MMCIPNYRALGCEKQKPVELLRELDKAPSVFGDFNTLPSVIDGTP